MVAMSRMNTASQFPYMVLAQAMFNVGHTIGRKISSIARFMYTKVVAFVTMTWP